MDPQTIEDGRDAQDSVNTAQDNAMTSLGHRMMNPKLMALRAQNPFLHITPFPNEIITIALAAGVATDINLPDGAKMIRFSGDGSYFVSRKGNAELPGASQNYGGGSLYKPEQRYFYVEEIRQFSVISAAGCNLSVECFVQL